MDENKIKTIINEVKGAKIVVASKYVDYNQIKEMLKLGLCDFGENRTDAFLEKYENLKGENITWHFIGHLQTNKAKLVASKIDYLHSLDSLRLAQALDKLRERPLKCFVEVHMTSSLTKNGVLKEDLPSFLESLKAYKKIEVIGLMTMTDSSQSDEEKYKVFKGLKDLASKYNLKELSMGMSDDYKIALSAGATYVRLGRIICM